MIDRTHALPVSRQVKLVGIARSSAYYQPQPVSESDLTLMRQINELHLEQRCVAQTVLRQIAQSFRLRTVGACGLFADDV